MERNKIGRRSVSKLAAAQTVDRRATMVNGPLPACMLIQYWLTGARQIYFRS